MADLVLPVKVRRGTKANLPSSAPDGVLLVCTDTGELFMGRGTGNALLRIPTTVLRSWTTTINNSGTFTFPQAFASPPVVTLTCVEGGSGNPFVAQLTEAPTATQCAIRVWRVGTLLGANQQDSAVVHIHAHGVPA